MLNKEGQLKSLAALFKHNHEYVLGIDQGRSFGDFLDHQIKGLDEHNLIIRSGGTRTKSLVKMLVKNRINYIIDYPTEIGRELKSYPDSIKMSSLEIAGMPEHIVGHVMCSKSEFGEKVITDINNVLVQLYKKNEFYKAHIDYIEQSNLFDFNKAYKNVFRTKIPSY
jgi:uncharacterized protein (TIGR02285 family)